jgi:hypothetical protein
MGGIMNKEFEMTKKMLADKGYPMLFKSEYCKSHMARVGNCEGCEGVEGCQRLASIGAITMASFKVSELIRPLGKDLYNMYANIIKDTVREIIKKDNTKEEIDCITMNCLHETKETAKLATAALMAKGDDNNVT